MNKLTILIVCYEKLDVIQKFIEGNYEILLKYPIIIVNKEGGEPLKSQQFNVTFFNQDSSFWFARRFGLEFIKTEYILNLDTDTILPPRYIEKAIKILEDDVNIACVAINYSKIAGRNYQDHFAFGTSIWRTEDLKKLYDWRLIPDFPQTVCECKYMWSKLEKIGKRMETLPIQAIHLIGPNRNIPLNELIRESTNL